MSGRRTAIAKMFVASLKAKMEWPCSATQEAIDRICEGLRCQSTGKTGRGAVGNFVLFPHFFATDLVYWKAPDVLLATGTAKDTWLCRIDS